MASDQTGPASSTLTETKIANRGRQVFVTLVIVLVISSIGFAGIGLTQDGGQPTVPAAYYGSVTVNGEPAPAGTNITAEIDGTVHGSIEITESGQYGGPEATDQKLVVRDGEAGDEVTFVVRGVAADTTVQWESGDVREVNLTFTGVPEESDEESQEETSAPSDGTTETGTDTDQTGGGQGAGGGTDTQDGGTSVPTTAEPAPASVTADVQGQSPSVTIDNAESVSRVEFESESELQATVEVSEVSEPPAPEPEGQQFVSGTEITFAEGDSSSVSTVRFGLNADTVADRGVTPDQLVVSHLDEETDSWESLETSVVSETDQEIVVEAPSAGFSTYGVFAQGDTETTTESDVESATTSEETTTLMPTDTMTGETTGAPETTDSQTPGFTIGLAVIALIGAALLALRRQ